MIQMNNSKAPSLFSRSLITATNISLTNGADSALLLLRSLCCISPLEPTARLDHHAIKRCICNSVKMGDLHHILDEIKTFTMHKKNNKLYVLWVITEQNSTGHGQPNILIRGANRDILS